MIATLLNRQNDWLRRVAEKYHRPVSDFDTFTSEDVTHEIAALLADYVREQARTFNTLKGAERLKMLASTDWIDTLAVEIARKQVK